MLHSTVKDIYIQMPDGERVRFSSAELQSRLIDCFLKSGLRENSFLSEDIALAIEYALLNSDRDELVFGAGELGAAVVRMLEETGFPEVAAQYRSSGSRTLISVDCSAEGVGTLLEKFLSLPGGNFEAVRARVCEAAEKLSLKRAPAHLLLELARYYQETLMEETVLPLPGALRSGKAESLEARTIVDSLPADAAEWISRGVIRINGISHLFPSIRLFFLFGNFAAWKQLPSPTTELELSFAMNQAAGVLEQICRHADQLTDSSEPLPIHLTLPDAVDFCVNYLCADRMRSEPLAEELAEMLSGNFPRKLYKLTIG